MELKTEGGPKVQTESSAEEVKTPGYEPQSYKLGPLECSVLSFFQSLSPGGQTEDGGRERGSELACGCVLLMMSDGGR